MADDIDEAYVAGLFNLSKKKKKSKQSVNEVDSSTHEAVTVSVTVSDATATVVAVANTVSESTTTTMSPEQEQEPAFPSYSEMLTNLYNCMNKGKLTEKKKLRIQPPKVARIGTKRTAWLNYKETCSILKRSVDHVFMFFCTELGVTGSISEERLLFDGRFDTNAIEQILRKYIKEYVECHMCRSIDTTFEKDSITRLHILSCINCTAQRTTLAIEKAFQAVRKNERKKARGTT